MSVVSGPGSISGLNTRLRFSFFLIETLSITGQKMGVSLKWQRPFTKGTIEEPEYFPCALGRQRNIPAISPPAPSGL